MRVLCLLILTGWILWKIRVFFQREKSLDRFVPVLPISDVDEQWLAKEILSHKPEVVGATWDKTTSTAEVAAVLARLVQEGKMESWMEPYLLPFFNFPVSTLLLFGMCCLIAAICNNIINMARADESAEGLAFRRKLAAAREYFKQELAREEPRIKDSWFPYLLAFGLGPKVDSWFHKYGSRGTGISSAGRSAGGGTGGGGSSGGGGGGGW